MDNIKEIVKKFKVTDHKSELKQVTDNEIVLSVTYKNPHISKETFTKEIIINDNIVIPSGLYLKFFDKLSTKLGKEIVFAPVKFEDIEEEQYCFHHDLCNFDVVGFFIYKGYYLHYDTHNESELSLVYDDKHTQMKGLIKVPTIIGDGGHADICPFKYKSFIDICRKIPDFDEKKIHKTQNHEDTH